MTARASLDAAEALDGEVAPQVFWVAVPVAVATDVALRVAVSAALA